jgi:hypothetical protein
MTAWLTTSVRTATDRVVLDLRGRGRPAVDEASDPFPLELTPFERYMLEDDRPDYPMAIIARAKLSALPRREAFVEAVVEALGRHPLLRARVRRSWRRAFWVPATGQRASVDWREDDAPVTCPSGARIDLAREVGLRLWMRRAGDGRGVLTLQYHHACCDGIGALQFLGDVFDSYHRMVTREDAPRVPRDAACLRERGRISTGEPPGGRRKAFDGRCVRELVRRYLWQRPVPLRVPDGAGQARGTFPHLLTTTLAPEELKGLHAAARGLGATTNDLLLRDLFLTLAEWGGSQWGRDWLRVLMPISLRDGEDLHMPAANRIGYVGLDRRVADCGAGRSDELLAGLRAETRASRFGQMGDVFLGIIEGCQSLGVLRPMLARRDCMATAVLTNLGEMSRWLDARPTRRGRCVEAGDIVVEELAGTAPVRPLTHAAFAVCTYAGSLTLAMQADPHVFAISDARALLELYARKVRATIGSAVTKVA